MSHRGAISLQLCSLIVTALLILGTSSGLSAASAAAVSSLPNQDQNLQTVFQTYDFDKNQTLSQSEFLQLFLVLFAKDEQRFIRPSAFQKTFAYLDIDGDHKLNAEEFRKAFQRWLLPIINTKSCLFLCAPHDAVNTDDLEGKITQLIKQSQDLFKVHYVFLSACNGSRLEPTSQLVEHVQMLLPKAYDITVYNVHTHLKSLKNNDFDQFIVHLANIKHDRSALNALMAHNSAKQHPTVVVTDESDRKQLNKYLDEDHLHSSIVVSPSLDARGRANYKSNLSLIVARKIFRQYKKLIY